LKKNPAIGELIDVVACDIGARPKDAPMFDVLAPHVLGLERSPTALRITFAPGAADHVAAFAAAERICCSALSFEVERDPVVLTITASPAQLDAMQQLFRRT
jgi:hypothetical protein